MCKILFVYPNKEGYPIIPIAISLLSGILKNANHKVELFDVTFMVPERLDHIAREKTRTVRHVDIEAYWGSGGTFDINDEFRKKIQSFDPDLIAFSIVENNYGCAKELFKTAKEVKNVPILVGGIFPTVVPKFFVEDKNVDLICVGEGERTIVEIADRIDCHGSLANIPNLITKSAGNIPKNINTKYYDWEPPVFQDWTLFDDRHLYKPFMGRMYRMGNFELSRGCPFNCSYCCNRTMQQLFKGLGKYNRERPIGQLIDEISYMKEGYRLELIFFNDENFLQMNKERFKDFCAEYKVIGLPFYITTRADSLLDEEKVRMLKDAGCISMGIGVEHGNKSIRKKLLNKVAPDWVLEKAFDNCNKVGIRTTAYVMIGLPFETEENIIETANFCKRLKTKSVGLAIFAPYYGTELRRICVENGFMEDKYYEDISVNYHSILTMPQISRQRMEELYYKFHSLVYGEGVEAS